MYPHHQPMKMSTESSPPPASASATAAIKSGKSRTRAPEAAPGFCKRCKDAKATVSARQAVFCRPCFLDGSMVKFRDAVARFKLPLALPGSPEVSAVVALSGGTCSRSLLHMVVGQYMLPRADSQQQQQQHRGPFSTLRVLFIDESEVIPCDPDYIERIRTTAAEYGLELQVARLSDIFRFSKADLVLELSNGSMSASARPSASNTELLQSIFTGTPSVSAKEDMMRTIRSRLLAHLAAEHNDKYLLLGSSTLTVAHQVISATVKGRGAAVHDMVSPMESALTPSASGVMMLKPLSGFSMKELALFAHFHRLDIVPLPTFTSGRPPGLKQGIEQVTMSFLLALEKAKEGTHSTVYKTAARLRRVEAEATCAMCRLTPLVHGEDELVEGATEYRGVCQGCARTLKELQMADKRGATRAVRVPLFDEIAEYLVHSEPDGDE
ncbi:hypothetical protein BCR44DRAFT_1252737 [Catenaria anguillulae PL171]|uniref:Cytoplasmic tRNA 2-thiolation protein 2 n=1 Tax=Catenaria anguillulae PL171 TaxID=765915 RepID=A0A1Y2HC12_9FUNG|nr:hypothetical protein BCR44DRAFT_1252737 [Catenaria anguillulae PL171]